MISPGFQSCEHTLNTLRYANRVKELGADSNDELNDNKMTDDENERFNEEDMNSGDDMELLKASVRMAVHPRQTSVLTFFDFPSAQSNDDLYNFHQTISHLTELEEEVLDMHKSVSEVTSCSFEAFLKFRFNLHRECANGHGNTKS